MKILSLCHDRRLIIGDNHRMAIEPTRRYRPVQRHMHWILFALVAMAYVLINLHHMTSRRSPWHEVTEHAHMFVGLLVLLLVLPRLWMRKKHGAPPIQPRMARWSGALARVTHWALYAFLVVQPLLGIIVREAGGKGVSLFGVTIVPAFVSHPNRALARAIFPYHAWIGTAFYYVIALHILAALWHHFVRRDDTMKRMLGSSRKADVAGG